MQAIGVVAYHSSALLEYQVVKRAGSCRDGHATWQAAGIRGRWNVGQAAEEQVWARGEGSGPRAAAAAAPGAAGPKEGEVPGLVGRRLGSPGRHLEVGVVRKEALQRGGGLAEVGVRL